MDNYFLNYNKALEETIDQCLHHIESRLDKLYEKSSSIHQNHNNPRAWNKALNGYNRNTFSCFKSPYIKDDRGFSAPTNEDARQITELAGSEDIEYIIKSKSWSADLKKQLVNAVLDFYSQIHLIKLIKQKNQLATQINESSQDYKKELQQKLNLIEEQAEQVKSRKEPRIFVPEDRLDTIVDWCSISAKLGSTSHDSNDCRLMWSNELHWSVNDGPWTKEEDECLLNAIQKHGKNNWDAVAKDLNSNRLAWQCCSRYQQEFSDSIKSINDDDVEKIVEVVNLCRIGNYVPWNQVMYFIKYYNVLQVKYQWSKLLLERKSEQNWSHHEDVLLLKAVERFGDKDWLRISSFIPGRSNKSCRERYTMRLKFDKRSIGAWRKYEDQALMSLYNQFGPNWALLASHFPFRNQHQLRNRHTLLSSGEASPSLKSIAPIKHKKLYRDANGYLTIFSRRRKKPSTEKEVDEKLSEILSIFQIVAGTSKKSIVCRSAQDDLIFHILIQSLRNHLFGATDPNPQSLLSVIVNRALKKKVTHGYQLLPPSVATIRGFRAWATQQSYLNQFQTDTTVDMNRIGSSPEYRSMLNTVINLFLWPALLSKLAKPDVDLAQIQSSPSMINDSNSKNFYTIRNLQNRICTSL